LKYAESVIVGKDSEEILARIKRGFEYHYNQYSRIKKQDIAAIDYETLQA
jgi:hypothetical protein